tara:strand:+ start:136 stop:531 length:396 start_codon:yes stop_codon:yes gene_type:complete
MYSLARRRTKLKAEVDARNEEKSRQLVERERVLNCRLEARGLLTRPADRMRKDDELMKAEILASLESTKAVELSKAKRLVKQEEASVNMARKNRAEEYKKVSGGSGRASGERAVERNEAKKLGEIERKKKN